MPAFSRYAARVLLAFSGITCLYATWSQAQSPAEFGNDSEPVIGKELSQQTGVSLIRHPEKSGPSQFGSKSNGLLRFKAVHFTAENATLLDAVEHVTGLNPRLIIGASTFPVGRCYSIKIAVRGDRTTAEAALFQALEQAFPLRVARQKRKMKVLVLGTAEDWRQIGFKPLSARIVTRGTWEYKLDGKIATYTIRNSNMDTLVGQIEHHLDRFILNETHLKDNFDMTVKVPYEGGVADFRKALAEHGLRLEEAERELDVVVIEKKVAD